MEFNFWREISSIKSSRFGCVWSGCRTYVERMMEEARVNGIALRISEDPYRPEMSVFRYRLSIA